MAQDDANILRLTDEIEQVAIDLAMWISLRNFYERLETDRGLQQFGGYDLVMHLAGKLMDQAYQQYEQGALDLVKNAYKK